VDTAPIKRWRAIETLLQRARAALPEPSRELQEHFDQAISAHQHYLSHNELGLAFEELRHAASLVPARGGVWKDLIRAAELMKLTEELPELHRRFEAAASSPSGTGGKGAV
jgi:hypothetical protein